MDDVHYPALQEQLARVAGQHGHANVNPRDMKSFEDVDEMRAFAKQRKAAGSN